MQLIYSKFSNERAEQFGIRTDILLEDGKKVIQKLPISDASCNHVRKLSDWYQALSKDFQDTCITVNVCSMKEDSAYLEFVDGICLEEKLDGLLETNQIETFDTAIRAFFDVILKQDHLKKFQVTDQFREVFGDVSLSDHEMARAVTDIDMVFSNVILSPKEDYCLIDYEWTFDFPIPIKYVIYRCLRYYILTNSKRFSLSLIDYCKKFDISEEERTAYEQMEEHFQHYISGNTESLSSIASSMAPRPLPVIAPMDEYYRRQGQCILYLDAGNGFSEDTRILMPVNPFGDVIEYNLYLTNGTKNVRIDPLDQSCLFRVDSMKLDDASIDYITNSTQLQESAYYSETDDPQIIVQNIPGGAKMLSFQMTIEPCGALVAQTMEFLRPKSFAERLPWRKKAAKLLSKKSPQLLYSIDRLELNYSYLVVYGWGLQPEKGTYIDIVAEDQDKKPFDMQLLRYIREDVNMQMGVSPDLETGFQVVIPLIAIRDYFVNLHLIGEETSVELKLDADEMKRNSYGNWFEKQLPNKTEQQKQRECVFPYMPVISIVIPVYNTPIPFLEDLLDTIQHQTYAKWELCLADASTGDAGKETTEHLKKCAKKDSRIRHIIVPENKGISGNTNVALEAATGDWIMFTDHDDLLTIDALYELVKTMNLNEDIDVVYSDEDKINGDGTVLFEPAFKPDFNLELLRENNYICHIFVVKRSLQTKVGMLRKEFDGAQDFDFVLRCCEQAKDIRHVAKILYHWRAHANSTAGNIDSKMYAFEAGRKAVEAHYERIGADVTVTSYGSFGHYRSHWPITGEPLVSILIPNKDHTDDLDLCVRSVIEKSTYRNFEIIVIENNSTEDETFEYYEKLQQTYEQVRVIKWEHEFNYAKIHNFAVPHTNGEYIVLLNNDIEIKAVDWLEEMLGYCEREDVGIVGGRLYYPDQTIQHAGVIVGLGGVAGHIFHGTPMNQRGYCDRIAVTQELSAVTAACLMTKKSYYEQVGGMDEQFDVSYNDVDYCLKIRDAGYRIVYNPYVEAWHYESKSRGYDVTNEKLERIKKESDIFAAKWHDILEQGDPFYNINLTRTSGNCTLRDEQDSVK
jgi:GT2 family glycosyltransferase